MNSKFYLIILMFMATTMFSTGMALATEVATADADSTIVVNGLKMDEGQNRAAASGALGVKSLLDTPFSVTVVDKEELARRQVTTIGQIFINDPSVSSFATAGTTN
jgi:iron complex outermembrane receptor protein